MPYQTPEELEQEADELHSKMMAAPLEDNDQGADSQGESNNDSAAVVEPEANKPTDGNADNAGVNNPDEGNDDPAEAAQAPDKAKGQKPSGKDKRQTKIDQERVKNAQARMHQATEEAAGERRKNDVLFNEVRELKSEVERLAKAPGKQTEVQNEGSISKSLESAMADYPEVIGPLVTQLEQMNSRIDAVEGVGQETAETVVAHREQVMQSEAKTAQEIHWNTIEQAHPDVGELAGSDDFRGWTLRQTPMIQQAIAGGSAEDVIQVIGMYKQDGTIPGEAAQQSGSANGPAPIAEVTPSPARAKAQPTNTAPFTRAEIRDMTAKEYADNEAAIDDAMVRGLIV